MKNNHENTMNLRYEILKACAAHHKAAHLMTTQPAVAGFFSD